jgi:hypothetical protein
MQLHRKINYFFSFKCIKCVKLRTVVRQLKYLRTPALQSQMVTLLGAASHYGCDDVEDDLTPVGVDICSWNQSLLTLFKLADSLSVIT